MHQNNALQPIDRHQWCLIRDHPPLPTICSPASYRHDEERGDDGDGYVDGDGEDSEAMQVISCPSL